MKQGHKKGVLKQEIAAGCQVPPDADFIFTYAHVSKSCGKDSKQQNQQHISFLFSVLNRRNLKSVTLIQLQHHICKFITAFKIKYKFSNMLLIN